MKREFISAAVMISAGGLVVGYAHAADAQSDSKDQQTVTQPAEPSPTSAEPPAPAPAPETAQSGSVESEDGSSQAGVAAATTVTNAQTPAPEAAQSGNAESEDSSRQAGVATATTEGNAQTNPNPVPAAGEASPAVGEQVPGDGKAADTSTAQGTAGNQQNVVDQNAQTEGANTPPSPPAPAAESAGAESGQKSGIETVVVTARRTAEDIQKVPVAITAFSAKDLQREKISTGQDLAGRIPSLVINSNSQGRNNEIPQIRGQGAVFGGSPGVIIYYGEVPLPSDSFSNNQGGPGKFFDLANLQVLKGSQGTLFGRNTTGGALVLEPHKPDPYFSASIKGELGDYEDKGVEGIYNAPLVEDKLFLRVGAKFYERGGFSTDPATGGKFDNKGFRTFRLGLMWKPTDDIDNYLLGYYTHSADNGTSEVFEQINGNRYSGVLSAGPINLPYTNVKVGCLAMALTGDRTCGQDVLAAQQASGLRSMNPNVPPDDIVDTQALIDSFNYRLNDYVTLRNIASYSVYKHSYKWDMDGTPLVLNEITTPANANSSNSGTYTEEMQVQSKLLSNSLKLTMGLYYENLQPSTPLSGSSLGQPGSQIPQGFGDTQVTTAQDLGVTKTVDAYSATRRSYGPYAQGTYDLGNAVDVLDGLNVTAGVRYSVDDAFGESEVGTYILNRLASGGELKSERVKTEAPTYTIGLDYKVPTSLFYAKYSRGYKSGGYSVAAVNPANLTFKPEFVKNYEIGDKSDFRIGEMPVRVDSALYYTDYTNMQRTAANAYSTGIVPEFGAATYNAGKAYIEGFETDAVIMPLPGLTIMANYSYSQAAYKDYTLSYFSYYGLALKDCDGNTMSNGATMHLECMPFTNLPKHQTSATISYVLPFDDSVGTIEPSVTYSFTDRQYSSSTTLPGDEPGAWLGAYGILNATIGWSNVYGSGFDLQVFGTNLADRTYRIANSNVWTTFFFQSSIYGEPRMYGLQLAYHWK